MHSTRGGGAHKVGKERGAAKLDELVCGDETCLRSAVIRHQTRMMLVVP